MFTVRSKPSPLTMIRDVVNRPAYQAYLRERNCLATAIYFEARGESARGQKGVAEVVLARTRVPGRPKTICGVVYEGSKRSTGCQFSFTCDGVADRVRNGDAWHQALRIATNTMRTGGKVNPVAGGATFYHADYVSPGWASRMVKVASIGQHVFYRPQRGRNL
jgi:spore germination cell wall hydrolase CwlJ-like protein